VPEKVPSPDPGSGGKLEDVAARSFMAATLPRATLAKTRARYPLRMTLLRPRVDELLPVLPVAPRPPFVHVPA
jgi:hypothetical protein